MDWAEFPIITQSTTRGAARSEQNNPAPDSVAPPVTYDALKVGDDPPQAIPPTAPRIVKPSRRAAALSPLRKNTPGPLRSPSITVESAPLSERSTSSTPPKSSAMLPGPLKVPAATSTVSPALAASIAG